MQHTVLLQPMSTPETIMLLLAVAALPKSSTLRALDIPRTYLVEAGIKHYPQRSTPWAPRVSNPHTVHLPPMGKGNTTYYLIPLG